MPGAFEARLAGPPLHLFTLNASTDYALAGSFTAQALTAGNVTYETFGGDGTSVTVAVAAGDIVAVHCGLPTRLKRIVGATTTAQLSIGIYEKL